MVKAPGFHGRKYRFDPWSGNQVPACGVWCGQKKKKGSLARVGVGGRRFLGFASLSPLNAFHCITSFNPVDG